MVDKFHALSIVENCMCLFDRRIYCLIFMLEGVQIDVGGLS